jgi:hypothetical protein
MRIKSPQRISPRPQSSDYFFPSISTKKASRCHFSHRSTPQPTQRPPTSKHIDNWSWHNSRQPKTIEKKMPQSRSHITMKNKMVQGLFRLLTHAASIYHNNMVLLEIVQGEDLSKSCRPRKEGHPYCMSSRSNEHLHKTSLVESLQYELFM